MTDFPQNIVHEIGVRLDALMTDHDVFLRSIRTSDPVMCIGIFAEDWTPQETSIEMRSQEPTLSRYTIKIQNMVKSADEVEGRELFAVNAKIIRGILYRDTTLHATLRGLSEEVLGTRERVKRFGVTRQRYLTGAVTRQWTFMATTDFWVETEATPL